jgi:hypothetical protein
MNELFLQLKSRNETLFFFGLICLIFSIIFLVMTKVSSLQVYGVNAWFKPFKFAFSTFTFAWAMAWYCHYLPHFQIRFFNWSVIGLLGFEIIYIAIMAGQGKTSHYNVSSPFFSAMYTLMALAASLVTIYTAYIGILFLSNDFPDLPAHYVWAIRLGIVIFVIFSFEGFLMGSRMNHSVGLENDNSNIFILGWSKVVGDLRVSHFIGMHALQVLPLLSFYVLRNTKLTVLAGLLYGLLALFTLLQALKGKPLFAKKQISEIQQNK